MQTNKHTPIKDWLINHIAHHPASLITMALKKFLKPKYSNLKTAIEQGFIRNLTEAVALSAHLAQLRKMAPNIAKRRAENYQSPGLWTEYPYLDTSALNIESNRGFVRAEDVRAAYFAESIVAIFNKDPAIQRPLPPFKSSLQAPGQR